MRGKGSIVYEEVQWRCRYRVQPCETRREPIPGGSAAPSMALKVSQGCTRYRHLRSKCGAVISESYNAFSG